MKTVTERYKNKGFVGRVGRVFLPGLLALVVLLGTFAPVAAAPRAANAPGWHTVRWGETLYSIGRYYNVSPQAIAAANELANPNRIYAGQRLYIPAAPPYPRQRACGTYYNVQRGDTLFHIARVYGIDAWRIAGANGIYNLNHIWWGQRLFIPCH